MLVTVSSPPGWHNAYLAPLGTTRCHAILPAGKFSPPTDGRVRPSSEGVGAEGCRLFGDYGMGMGALPGGMMGGLGTMQQGYGMGLTAGMPFGF